MATELLVWFSTEVAGLGSVVPKSGIKKCLMVTLERVKEDIQAWFWLMLPQVTSACSMPECCEGLRYRYNPVFQSCTFEK